MPKVINIAPASIVIHFMGNPSEFSPAGSFFPADHPQWLSLDIYRANAKKTKLFHASIHINLKVNFVISNFPPASFVQRPRAFKLSASELFTLQTLFFIDTFVIPISCNLCGQEQWALIVNIDTPFSVLSSSRDSGDLFRSISLTEIQEAYCLYDL